MSTKAFLKVPFHIQTGPCQQGWQGQAKVSQQQHRWGNGIALQHRCGNSYCNKVGKTGKNCQNHQSITPVCCGAVDYYSVVKHLTARGRNREKNCKAIFKRLFVAVCCGAQGGNRRKIVSISYNKLAFCHSTQSLVPAVAIQQDSYKNKICHLGDNITAQRQGWQQWLFLGSEIAQQQSGNNWEKWL